MPATKRMEHFYDDLATPFQEGGSSDGREHATLPPTHWPLIMSFLKIGTTGFGGGMAIIALMEEEFVRRQGVLTTEQFLSGVGLSQILGAFPVNTAAYIGYQLLGFSGALVAVTAFLLPSVSLVILLSHLYFLFHSIPALQSMVQGIGPVVIALVLNASWTLGRDVLHSRLSIAIALCAFAAALFLVNPVWIILLAAVVGVLCVRDSFAPSASAPPQRQGSKERRHSLAFGIGVSGKIFAIAGTFLKVGIAFFGGGFVLIPLLQTRLVVDLGWLTPQEFLDGLAISTLTPGPIAVIATFVGYHRAGIFGAITATVALLGPGILLSVLASDTYTRYHNSPVLRRAMSGLQPATAGLILSAAILLGRHSVSSWGSALLVGAALFLLRRKRWHPALVLAVGAAVGYLEILT